MSNRELARRIAEDTTNLTEVKARRGTEYRFVNKSVTVIYTLEGSAMVRCEYHKSEGYPRSTERFEV